MTAALRKKDEEPAINIKCTIGVLTIALGWNNN
ncbi:unknown [Prevotella sp. CAG:487]|nr:unknown [Prevotella sp. CAG:487]